MRITIARRNPERRRVPARFLQRGRPESKDLMFLPDNAHALQSAAMFDRRYFVYMLQSVSRRALYIGMTNFLIMRVIEHRTRKYPNSFSAKYRMWRLVYYEELGDAGAALDRERQLKGWSRAKKEALIIKLNPKWRDIIGEWEDKYGLEFRLDGRITPKLDQLQQQNQNQEQNPNKRSSDSGIPR
jgi:putative endonuclease